jgi:cytochrome P450
MGTLMLIAGPETTANMIALGTLVLLEHPDQLALLRDNCDPKLVASAVEELLRYLNIVHNGRMRVAREDIEIAGRTIRADEALIMPNEIANRDPDMLPNPDQMDITRDARRHVAFGFGVHQCLASRWPRTHSIRTSPRPWAPHGLSPKHLNQRRSISDEGHRGRRQVLRRRHLRHGRAGGVRPA